LDIPGVNVEKLFSFVTDGEAEKATAFVLGFLRLVKSFQVRLGA